MLNQVPAIYCICDDILKTFRFVDDIQCKMSSAEVMTFAIISATFYGCDYRKARLVSLCHRYFPKILSHSQLVRRIHQIPEHIWLLLFETLKLLIMNKKDDLLIVDSFPVKAYENHKSFRAKIFKGKEYHGYTASKKSYFFGIKVHMVVTREGVPIEFAFTPGSHSDIKTLKTFHLSSLGKSTILADRAYTDYKFEDELKTTEELYLLPKRKKNLKRQNSSEEEFLLWKHRNFIESVFSCIVRKLPRYICARTEKGFCLKVFFCILAYMIERVSPLA